MKSSALSASADPDASDSAHPRTRWSVILLAVAAGIVIAFQIGKIPASIPTLQTELELSLVDAGWAISLLYAFAAITGLAAGAVADRFGARRIAIAGLLIAGAGSVVGGLAQDLWSLLASRVIEGIGAVSVLVTAPGLILRAVQPQDMRLAMGLWGTFMPTGIAIMLLLTPVLLATIGWRGMWFANTGIVVAFSAWLWVGTRSAPDPVEHPDHRDSFWETATAVLRRPGPLLLASIFGCYAFTFLCVTAFLPKYLIQEHAWDAGSAAVATALVIGANAPGNLIGGWLAHRGAARWLLIAIGIGTMAVTAWFIYQPWLGDVARIAVAVSFSLVGGLLPSSVYSSVQMHSPQPDKVAGVNGLILQGTNIGQLTGPPLFAMIVAASTWGQGPWLMVGIASVAVGLAVTLGRLERKTAATGAA
jgi:predicted MFS family arabinose efflux permease